MGSGCSNIPDNKHIVIIGCGYGGKKLADNLLKLNAKIAIIDIKDSFLHNCAAVRTTVDESYGRNMFIPYKPKYGDCFRQGKVVKIDSKSKKITLENGDEISYDILVISTGSFGPMKQFTANTEESRKIYAHYHESVKKSDSILIVGGGAVGIETACEIKTEYPDKEVNVIHNGSKPVMENAPSNFINRVTALLKQLNVNMIYGEKAENIDDIESGVAGSYEIKTDKGRVVKAGVVFKTTGLKVNKSAYENSLDLLGETRLPSFTGNNGDKTLVCVADAVDERGALKVNDFFQVKGQEGIFAIGDCTDVKVNKLAYVAALQADLLSSNLCKLLNGQTMSPWSISYVTYLMALAMGRHHGVGCTLGGWMLPEFAVVYAKSKDLMLGRFYSEMGQKIPQ